MTGIVKLVFHSSLIVRMLRTRSADPQSWNRIVRLVGQAGVELSVSFSLVVRLVRPVDRHYGATFGSSETSFRVRTLVATRKQ